MRDYFTMSLLAAVMVLGCGPDRTTFARFPTAATAFDRAGSDPKAVAIADRVVAAAGGAARWNQVKQIKWTEVITADGKLVLTYDQAWDRWNGRHHGRLRHTPTAVELQRPSQATTAGDVVVMRKLYDEGGRAFLDSGKGLSPLGASDVPRELKSARERWMLDGALLCMSFLLEEPGTKLEYVGEPAVEAGKPVLDDIKVTLDTKDPNWTARYHVQVNRDTNMIDRIEIIEAGQPETRRIAYQLSSWTEVGGLKFPTSNQNIGTNGELITFKDIGVGDPDDTLYVPVAQ